MRFSTLVKTLFVVSMGVAMVQGQEYNETESEGGYDHHHEEQISNVINIQFADIFEGYVPVDREARQVQASSPTSEIRIGSNTINVNFNDMFVGL